MLPNLFFRGGTRRNPKDPKAQKPTGRTTLGKKSIKKFLTATTEDVIKQTDDEEIAEKLHDAKISKVGKRIINFNYLNNYLNNTYLSKEILSYPNNYLTKLKYLIYVLIILFPDLLSVKNTNI